MAKLKDYFESDLDTFINADEFATSHQVNGVDMDIIIDSETLKERRSKIETYEGDVLFHVKESDYGEAPAIEQIIYFDDEIYRVSDVGDEEGLYTITLKRNM